MKFWVFISLSFFFIYQLMYTQTNSPLTENKSTPFGSFMAIGSFQKIKIFDNQNNLVLTNEQEKQYVSLKKGLNIISVTPKPNAYNWLFNEKENNVIFMIQNNSMTNVAQELDQYLYPPTTYIYLSGGIQNLLLSNYYVFFTEVGIRFPISSILKFKFGINFTTQIIPDSSVFSNYIATGWGATVGIEFGILKPSYLEEYIISWFLDCIINIPLLTGNRYAINTGINFRLHTFFSFNIGIGLNYFTQNFKLFLPPPENNYNKKGEDFCIFINYDILFPIQKEKKIIHLNY
ncbi:MAG: hypothetical protein A2014_06000 [Spirochaetes bacterium GWF1_49_6]|nr:MAG: hypothetical protein A2014_06000 [Spirochaetes bacterium GWF1_49_6]